MHGNRVQYVQCHTRAAPESIQAPMCAIDTMAVKFSLKGGFVYLLIHINSHDRESIAFENVPDTAVSNAGYSEAKRRLSTKLTLYRNLHRSEMPTSLSISSCLSLQSPPKSILTCRNHNKLYKNILALAAKQNRRGIFPFFQLIFFSHSLSIDVIYIFLSWFYF